jgi:hypothetical protein
MLRILSGTQQGWFGKYGLQPGFIEALAEHRGQNSAVGAT